jgi:hypothetical protein
MGHKIDAPRRSTISQAELELVLWKHRLKFRADYIRQDAPFWKRHLLETLASDLCTEEKVLNIVLCIHADSGTGENARPCLDRIQALTGLTRPTIIKYLNSEDASLVKMGWIAKTATGAGRSPNTYAVIIPQRTIDELIAKFGAASGKAALPLQASGQPALPLEPPVVVNGAYHYEAGKARSGKNGRRSGKRGLPDTIDTISLTERASSKNRSRERTRLPDGWVLPQEYRTYASSTHQLNDWQIDYIARGFYRYWTGPDAKGQGLKADWFRTWQNWIDDKVARREVPSDAQARNGRGHDDGSRSARRELDSLRRTSS